MTAPDFAIDEVAELDCIHAPAPWPFAEDEAAAIEAHWAALVNRQPSLFNGRVLLLTRGAVERPADGPAVFRGAYAEVDFKAFLAWRDFGHPGGGVRNGFGMAALRGTDGGFVLGEMAAHTANAGRIYFPSGTPDRSDIVAGRVDLAGSIRRELAEETGLDPATLAFAPRFTLLHDAVRVCIMQAVVALEPAAALAERIAATLAGQRQPEFARMHVVRGEADLRPTMPAFVTAYLRRVWAAER